MCSIWVGGAVSGEIRDESGEGENFELMHHHQADPESTGCKKCTGQPPPLNDSFIDQFYSHVKW